MTHYVSKKQFCAKLSEALGLTRAWTSLTIKADWAGGGPVRFVVEYPITADDADAIANLLKGVDMSVVNLDEELP